MPIRVAIAGCGGRMGRLLLAGTLSEPHLVLVGGFDTGSGIAGNDLGLLAGGKTLGLLADADSDRSLTVANVIVDFTVPQATVSLAKHAAEAGVALVIGTTGMTAAEQGVIATAAERIPIVMAANFSLGVNLLLELVQRAAAVLGPAYDIEILEMHHRRKIDAPSGTALALGHAAAAGRGGTLNALQLPPRAGISGPRPPQGIGFMSLRGGDVVGDHTVIFAGDSERVELVHRAGDRRIFAEGALYAARHIKGRAAGLYGMAEMLAWNAPPSGS